VDLGLAGKTVIITGGSGAIGRGLVLEFAREGSNVISADPDIAVGDQLVKRARDQGCSGTVVAIATDVADRDSVDAMVAAANASFGPVDVLVNNAGGGRTIGAFTDLGIADRAWEIGVNIDGVVNCSQAVADDMLSRRTGSIINLSSVAALNGPSGVGVVNYAGAKGFVKSFTKALASEWGPRGVRVNTIAPGWIVPHHREEISRASFWNRIEGVDEESLQRSLADGTLVNGGALPIQRLGRPEDVAYLALFLASDRSSHITGQLVTVGGGMYMP
jgi:NAD(P)-dependent dehydrogenase (short-subunit alcohol dehydrogenase family)